MVERNHMEGKEVREFKRQCNIMEKVSNIKKSKMKRREKKERFEKS